ncbi:hypothetical protein G352_25092 [Rhodococcus ruber BKS 20-38]|uniref:DUF6802 domain-containing protein n=1 Tax=Rhodococcus ruber BKS 20-38 TaxID=1278076 RepID=M2XRX3_9NOCA|nr:DUF6802 family protein [Rhodococcus ruber]EME51900.1 hypothetical protein G352_25092 [Rhodococcus ruber BKS 20-38]
MVDGSIDIDDGEPGPPVPGRPAFVPGLVPALLDPVGPGALPPAVDVDGDGLPETVTFATAEALVVASDTDADGWFDRVTELGDDGRFGVWQFRRDVDGAEFWTRIDEGHLDGGK